MNINFRSVGEGFLGFCLIILLILLIIGLFCITPMVVLWGFNTLAEMAGSTLYIPHTFWSYIAVIAISVLFGSCRGSK